MICNIEFWNKEMYLPTKRHKRLRERYVKNNVDVDIKEVSEHEFPVAFIIHEYKSVYKNAKSYSDFTEDGEFKMFSEEIRTYNGKLYKPVRITHGAAIGLQFESFDYIKRSLTGCAPYQIGGKDFSDASIIESSDFDSCKKDILSRADEFIIFDRKVWKTCNEPMYVICTFGLGHNHGGTGFFIEDFYNPNIGRDHYFNALEREQAVAFGKKVAADRGDTESIEGMGDNNIIEVFMPELVTRNPQIEHGEGDSFINSIEELIKATDNSVEAGLLAIAMCSF